MKKNTTKRATKIELFIYTKIAFHCWFLCSRIKMLTHFILNDKYAIQLIIKARSVPCFLQCVTWPCKNIAVVFGIYSFWSTNIFLCVSKTFKKFALSNSRFKCLSSDTIFVKKLTVLLNTLRLELKRRLLINKWSYDFKLINAYF